MDPISISAIVISIISALGALLSRLRFRHCHTLCCDSDCIRTPDNSPPPTPKTYKHDENEIYTNTSDYV
jgi:hypothetical protein